MGITRSDLLYDLPEELIAQFPSERRTSSKLLVADRSKGTLEETVFENLPSFLKRLDLVVFNDTRVFSARLKGFKSTSGGRIEVLLINQINQQDDLWKALIRPSRRIRKGMELLFSNELTACIEDVLTGGKVEIRFSSNSGNVFRRIQATGEIPLPPYIKRNPVEEDAERYQTVFAQKPGAVAAPTAGLHFSGDLLGKMRQKDIKLSFLTLHVGPGTFLPLRSEILENNSLEPETFLIPGNTIKELQGAIAEHRRIIAVGTTTTRVLESINIFNPEMLTGTTGETDLFIFPPFEFSIVNTLVTNFHLPGSSLLALVGAFMGMDFMKEAYAYAVSNHFRFYSYGDAMLII